MGTRWRPTRALHRGIWVAAAAGLAAAVLGSVELLLVAVPFAVGTAFSLLTRPHQLPSTRLTVVDPTSVEGGPVKGQVEVDNDEPQLLLCTVAAAVPAWLTLRHGTGYYAALVRPSATTLVHLHGTAHRWGEHRLGPAVVQVVAADGLLAAQQRALPAVPVAVFPTSEVFDSDQPLPRASGIAGIHRSRRPGDSGELADVRPFQTGDRLRRINWRVSRRTGSMHVNATLSDRDAEVLLLLDVRHEAGVTTGVGGPPTVLDATVRSAAALVTHYAHQGDRVALVEYGPRLRRLRSGAGRRHVLTALSWLAATDPHPRNWSVGGRFFSRALHPPNALVFMLTPLLDGDAAALLAMLARAGRSVVAVDTLPPVVTPAVESIWTPAAVRLWQLERANLVGRLRELGVPVEAWRGAGSLDLVLRHVHRVATSSRVMVR